MGDGTKRKLTMPQWHIPYLEKHRIYDLFHELARELIIQQPPDHVLFLKQILIQAAKNRDTARVVILSSPKVNGYEVARQISLYTHQTVIGENAVLAQGCMMKPRGSIQPSDLIKSLARLLRTEKVYKSGWILVDCIRNAQEAKAMLEAGILPTHVFYLIPPFMPPLNELLYCHVSEGWPEYRRTIMGVRDAFKSTLIELFLQNKNLEEIVAECVKLINIRKGFGGPKQPRILILGPRGCGRKTQAKLLAQHLNIIHVEFEYLLCQAWVCDSELGKKLRACKEEVCFQSDLLAQIVNNRLLRDDCLEKGWVLTGFPYTVDDFKHLDCLDTPPNRVVFLDCNLSVCKRRLEHRKVNVYTGAAPTNNISESTELLNRVLATHPKDYQDIIDAELNYYCEHYGSLRSYCGETATVVNGDQPERWVFECISAVLVRPAGAGPVRSPCEKENDDGDVASNTSTNAYSPVFNTFINQF